MHTVWVAISLRGQQFGRRWRGPYRNRAGKLPFNESISTYGSIVLCYKHIDIGPAHPPVSGSMGSKSGCRLIDIQATSKFV